METKQRFGYMKGLKSTLGSDEFVTVDPQGLSGGLAVMWKKHYNVEVLSKDNRIIDLKISLRATSFYLTCVYGDPEPDRRQ